MPSLPRSLALVVTIAVAGGLAACGADDGATASFSAPTDGARAAGGLDVELTAEGITIEEAGTVRDGAGHFHILVDTGCAATGDAIAKDADHVHLGRGQDRATVYLAPGRHELCVQVGDGEHMALDVTDTVSVDVGIDDLDQWCAVVGELDGLFFNLDNSSDDFATKQVGYENARRLLSQLDGGLDLVDAAERDAVTEALDMAAELATVLATAADEAEAEAELAPLWESGVDTEPAAQWIQERCGVDIDG